MEYPVWQLGGINGGLLIAVISVLHVFIAHFAVGGGLFLVLTEIKARRENSPVLLEYVKKHTRFFLLVTMVFGGVSGVGIWFIIALVAPGATSTLIHAFVWAWATEWVFFLAEIASLLIYYYKFDAMRPKDHQFVGWMYFVFAWLSLLVINGVVAFMLTPGGWLQSGNFWQGFFNPSFWPSLFFRSFLSFTLAGLFAFVTAVYIKDKAARTSMVRYSALWVAAPFLLLVASGWWYLAAMPEAQHAMITAKSAQTPGLVNHFLPVAGAVLLAGLIMAYAVPQKMRKPLTYVLLLLGLTQVGVFEWARETGRRPFVIYNHTYSNGITVEQAQALNQGGFLAQTPWAVNKEITDENRLAAGKEIFTMQCSVCHGTGQALLDIMPRTAKFTVTGMDSQLNGQGKLREYMPPFVGNTEDRLALASYIVQELHAKDETSAPFEYPDLPTEIPPFDPDQDEYTLLAWNNLGMHCISDSDPYWILLPPANDLFAMLIRRDSLPEVVTENVVITYSVEKGFENPAAHVRFWEFSEALFGKRLPENVGVGGNGLSGDMELNEDLRAFHADLVPVVPYPDEPADSFNPYPIFHIEAKDAETGEVLARTSMVAPTSTEMGCKNCHGGEWRVAGAAGFTDETSADVLAVHDKINGTTLKADAEAGQPKLCQSCHADPVLGTPGTPEILAFPAAIHGWHANYLTDRGAEACAYCHPNAEDGATRCLRGRHADGLDCTDCHGYLEDHALSLLKKEQELGKPSAALLMKHLTPRSVASVDEIIGRTPWLMEPDCTSCHDFEETPFPGDVKAFNKWTSGEPGELYRMRTDDMDAIMCEACHGSTHAVYPAENGFGENRDNIQPMQYQGEARAIGGGGNCAVCHTEDMEDPAHHPIPGM